MIALLLTFLMWSHPAPQLWVCNPGKSPMPRPITNCQRVHYSVLTKLPMFGTKP